MQPNLPVHSGWVRLQREKKAAFTEAYGFTGNQDNLKLEGVRFRLADGRASDTPMVFSYRASTLLLPVPRAMAATEGESGPIVGTLVCTVLPAKGIPSSCHRPSLGAQQG